MAKFIRNQMRTQHTQKKNRVTEWQTRKTRQTDAYNICGTHGGEQIKQQKKKQTHEKFAITLHSFGNTDSQWWKTGAFDSWYTYGPMWKFYFTVFQWHIVVQKRYWYYLIAFCDGPHSLSFTGVFSFFLTLLLRHVLSFIICCTISI